MSELAALFHSAEDVIEMWEKAEIAAAAIPAPEGVQCSVFDDGYTNVAGPSDAVFVNDGLQACIPGGANGICRKWFGRCTTSVTHTPVYFSVFDDGYANQSGNSDATFVKGGGSILGVQACTPGGANGTCRKWFGRGVTKDGHKLLCNVLSDGYTDILGPTDAIFPSRNLIGTPIPTQVEMQLCLPNGPAGACRKWFGRCIVEP